MPTTHLLSFALGRLGCSRVPGQLAHSLDQVALDNFDATVPVIGADQVRVWKRLALLVVARADRDLALPIDEHAVAQAAARAAPLGNLLRDHFVAIAQDVGLVGDVGIHAVASMSARSSSSTRSRSWRLSSRSSWAMRARGALVS